MREEHVSVGGSCKQISFLSKVWLLSCWMVKVQLKSTNVKVAVFLYTVSIKTTLSNNLHKSALFSVLNLLANVWKIIFLKSCMLLITSQRYSNRHKRPYMNFLHVEDESKHTIIQNHSDAHLLVRSVHWCFHGFFMYRRMKMLIYTCPHFYSRSF